MKKLTVFLTLLLCVCFSEMSAANYPLIWDRSEGTYLTISVNGITVLNIGECTGTVYENGVLMVPEGAFVEVFANKCVAHHPLDVIVCEYGLREYGPFMDYNFLNEYNSRVYEWFTMPQDIEMYVSIN